jgi:uncharacterized membrane protein
MNGRYLGIAVVIMGVVLLAHSITAFSKMRWVTGLLEVIAALLMIAHWWVSRAPNITTGTAPKS